MPPIRIEHDSDCWSTLGPSETEVQPKYYKRRSSAHRSAPSMQLLHGRRHSVCKRHPRTRTWSFSFSFSRFSLMQPSLLLLPKTVACSYPEGGTWRCFVYARQMCVTKGKCVLQKKNVCLCERQMCVCKQNIIRGRRFVMKGTCVFTKGKCVFWNANVVFIKGKCAFVKITLLTEKCFALWKANVCYERQMCVLKDKCVFSKRKYWKHRFQKANIAKTSLKTQILRHKRQMLKREMFLL